MLVKSYMKDTVRYAKCGTIVTLEPGKVNEVDDGIVTAGELVACYGQRIRVLNKREEEAYRAEQAAAAAEEHIDVIFPDGKTPTMEDLVKEINDVPQEQLDADVLTLQKAIEVVKAQKCEACDKKEGCKADPNACEEKADETKDIPEVCTECYADGKTPADEDCEKCDKKETPAEEVETPVVDEPKKDETPVQVEEKKPARRGRKKASN